MIWRWLGPIICTGAAAYVWYALHIAEPERECRPAFVVMADEDKTFL